MINFRVKRLTDSAKLPERANEGDLWDLFADSFCADYLQDKKILCDGSDSHTLQPTERVLVKTGIALELPVKIESCKYEVFKSAYQDLFDDDVLRVSNYAVADIRPRSGLALKHGITVLNSPGTIDNSYQKEIGVIIYNAGSKPYTINKGDKIAQMLIRSLDVSEFQEVSEFSSESERGGFGSTGK